MRSTHALRRPGFRIFCLFCICAAAFAYFSWCTPLASDDYEFAGLHFSNLSEIIKYALYYGNGRFLGNLGAVLMTQMPILAVPVKALLISGMIFLVPAVLGIRSTTGYLLSFLLFVSIPPSLFAEVYTWTSGFQNYIPPIWTALMILFLLKQYGSLSSRWTKGLFCVAIFLLGVAGQLFVEHSSLANLILAGCLVFHQCRKKERIAPAVTWLAAAAIGFVIMLLIPRLFYLEGNRAEGYRSLNLDGIGQLLDSVIDAFSDIGAAIPPLGSIILSGFTVITTYVTRAARSKKMNSLLYCVCLFSVIYILLNEFLLRNTWYGRMVTVRNLTTALTLVLPYLLWPISLYFWENKPLRKKICFLLVLALLPLAPLLIVSPTPDRLVFHAYVCTAAVILLFSKHLAQKADVKPLSLLRRSIQCVAIAIMLMLCLVFTNVAWISNMRDTHIQQEMAAGKEVITIFPIPYEYVHWDGVWCFGRKYYYEEWYDISFTSTEYKVWYRFYRAK